MLFGVHLAHLGNAGRSQCRAGGPQAPVGCSLADLQVVQDEGRGSQLANVAHWLV